MPWALLFKLPGSPNTHCCELHSVAGHRALCTKPNGRLGDPGYSAQTVAGLEEVAVKRKVVQHQFGLQCAEEVDASAGSGILGCSPVQPSFGRFDGG